MKNHKYKSYAEYTKAQIDGYVKKYGNVWADAENLKFIAGMVPATASSGLCHGVRNGFEIKVFAAALPDCLITGTEIGVPIEKFIVQWDFNKVNPAWIGRFDFIYSNSWDHAYDIAATLNVWTDQLRPGGRMFLEHSDQHVKATKLDPTGMTAAELAGLLPGSKIIDLPVVKNNRKVICYEKK